ncbi:transglutaminase domain-containing protein [Paenibacillus taiwanensis]|uniref:transglutaminase domain-containing protein n=1 Tax=Paenibacillus taiwanensis TaxID=401638 RepID=UPI00068481E1|nr:transglutaminase domain-containing protein [Paenibacillus taiwanensis]
MEKSDDLNAAISKLFLVISRLDSPNSWNTGLLEYVIVMRARSGIRCALTVNVEWERTTAKGIRVNISITRQCSHMSYGTILITAAEKGLSVPEVIVLDGRVYLQHVGQAPEHEGVQLRRVRPKRGWRRVVRGLLVTVLLFLFVVQTITWSTAEAESAKMSFSETTTMRQWMTERLAEREGLFTFKYSGDTGKLTANLSEAMNVALHSDPFIRYNVSRYSFHWKGTEQSALVTVTVEYRETYAESLYVRQEAKRIVKELLSAKMSDYETVKKLHDYVVLHVAYDESLNKFTAYEALVDKKTVCQGYALLMQALLEEADIPSIVLEGQAGGTLHAWNVVQVDGLWYHLDTTWDDPVPDQKDGLRHTYFLLSDEEMKVDHRWDVLKAPRADKAFSIK